MAIAETSRLVAELSLKDKLTGGVNKALGSVDKLDQGIGRAGKGAGQMAAGFARAGVIIAGAATTGIGFAAKAAIDWETAISGVRKTVGGDVSDIAKGIRKMATEMPIAATELAGIAEAAGALGVARADIVGFTDVVAKLSVTTDLTSEAAATSLGHLRTTLGLTGKDFTEFGDSLVYLGNTGASTESEILGMAENIAGAAGVVGASKEQVLGWAAAMANTGEEAEAGGTSVQQFWLKSFKDINKGGKNLKLYAKTLGLTEKATQDAFGADATGTLSKFIISLGKLSKAEQLATLDSLGFTGVRSQRAMLKLLANTDNLTDSLENAGNATGALGKEAQIRFETVASSIAKLKNNVLEAAITIGEGLTPALGRAASKLSAALADPVTAGTLKAIGEDLGKAIDEIDWKQVVAGGRELIGVAKGALSVLKAMFDVVNALPGPIKEAGIGLLAINKLSGGLFGAGAGNIIGGLGQVVARGAASKVPGLGRLVAQPVFVTNWPLGGVGGVPGAAGGPGVLARGAAAVAGLGAAGIASVAVVAIAPAAMAALGVELAGGPQAIAARNLQARRDTAAARGVPEFNRPTSPGRTPAQGSDAWKASIAQGVKSGLAGLDTAIANANRKVVLPADRSANAAVQSGLASLDVAIANGATKEAGAAALLYGAQLRTAQATDIARGAIERGTGAVHSGTSQIVAAIRGIHIPPIVLPTNKVTTTVIRQYRYGPATGSSGTGHSAARKPL